MYVSNSANIFLFDMCFENLIVGLHVLIIFSIIEKFQEDQKLIAISSIKCLNFKFLWFKTMYKKLSLSIKY